MSKRSYAIVGTGALGGYYGGCLAHAGHPVHFLLRSDYQQVKDCGLKVESPNGNFHIQPANAYHNTADIPACDVVIVSLKTTQNHQLEKILPPLIHDDTVVLMLQNGLGNESLAAQFVNPEHVYGGLCFLCSNKIAPGHIHHLDYGKITIGKHTATGEPGGLDETMQQIVDDFENAGIEMEMIDSLRTGRWKKLVWNIPYNGLSVILNATTDKLMADPDTLILIEKIMQQVLDASEACGCPLPPDTPSIMLGLTKNMAPYRTSMIIDYDEHRPLEVEAMFGEPVRQAKAAGFDCPLIETLYRQLAFLDRQNRSG